MKGNRYFRPLQIALVVSIGGVVVCLVLLAFLSWLDLQRLRPLEVHMAYLHEVQEAVVDLEDLIARRVVLGEPPDDQREAELGLKLEGLAVGGVYLAENSRRQMDAVRIQITSVEPLDDRELVLALEDLRRVLDLETTAHEEALRGVTRIEQLELRVSSVVMVAVPLLGLGLWFALRNRLVGRLEQLGGLMTQLSRQEYNAVATTDADPLLRPLLLRYNALVTRLEELERAHRVRQAGLEERVHAVSRELLRQQGELARAERLAAVGEVAAGLAHELRNPLAGVQMAVTNMQQEASAVDPELAARLDRVGEELRRVVRLLNETLEGARLDPEPVGEVEIGPLVQELLELVRYQVTAGIELRAEVEDGLTCRLPEGRLRQALLNLVLNGAQATGGRHGTVTVRTEVDGGDATFSVEDDGPGYPPALLQHGVQPFHSGREGGTGLGLAMVRRFAHECGGELRLSNRIGGGAVASLHLPCGETDV